MIQEQINLLKNAGILENDYDSCYITENNQIFSPLKDESGKMIKTGEQVYKEDYLNPSAPSLNLEERVTLIENLQLQQGGLI